MLKSDMFDVVAYPAAYGIKDACHTHSLADCKTVTVSEAVPKAACGWKNKKDENPMTNYAAATVVTADSIEKDQRRALSSALYIAFRAKVDAAKKQFGLTGDTPPETTEEMIQRIQDGKFVLPEKYEDQYASASYIEWRDPAIKQDKDGYKAARKELDTEYSALELKLAIIPVADGLAAVEAYRDAK